VRDSYFSTEKKPLQSEENYHFPSSIRSFNKQDHAKEIQLKSSDNDSYTITNDSFKEAIEAQRAKGLNSKEKYKTLNDIKEEREGEDKDELPPPMAPLAKKIQSENYDYLEYKQAFGKYDNQNVRTVERFDDDSFEQEQGLEFSPGMDLSIRRVVSPSPERKGQNKEFNRKNTKNSSSKVNSEIDAAFKKIPINYIESADVSIQRGSIDRQFFNSPGIEVEDIDFTNQNPKVLKALLNDYKEEKSNLLRRLQKLEGRIKNVEHALGDHIKSGSNLSERGSKLVGLTYVKPRLADSAIMSSQDNLTHKNNRDFNFGTFQLDGSFVEANSSQKKRRASHSVDGVSFPQTKDQDVFAFNAESSQFQMRPKRLESTSPPRRIMIDKSFSPIRVPMTQEKSTSVNLERKNRRLSHSSNYSKEPKKISRFSVRKSKTPSNNPKQYKMKTENIVVSELDINDDNVEDEEPIITLYPKDISNMFQRYLIEGSRSIRFENPNKKTNVRSKKKTSRFAHFTIDDTVSKSYNLRSKSKIEANSREKRNAKSPYLIAVKRTNNKRERPGSYNFSTRLHANSINFNYKKMDF